MKIDPASIMDGFRDQSWNVQNTIRSLPGLIVVMLQNKHEDGTPFWARIVFQDATFEHASVQDWIRSKSRAGLGMTMGYLLNMLAAHDDLVGPESAKQARTLLSEHGVSAASAVLVDTEKLKGTGKRGKAKRVDIINPFSEGGTSATYLAGRIKRDRPDIAERIQAGEFRSIHAAAIAAGIAKPTITIRPTVEGFTKAIKKRLTPEQIRELVQNLSGA
jgi:hypothetical protein